MCFEIAGADTLKGFRELGHGGLSDRQAREDPAADPARQLEEFQKRLAQALSLIH